MPNESLKTSLKKLQDSLGRSEIDEETLALAQELEANIQKLLDTEQHPEKIDSSMDVAAALEAKFEAEHPITAGIVREVINALHRMGV